jgi:signal transduction histidine kinase
MGLETLAWRQQVLPRSGRDQSLPLSRGIRVLVFVGYVIVGTSLAMFLRTGRASDTLAVAIGAALFALAIAAPVIFGTHGAVFASLLLVVGFVASVLVLKREASQYYRMILAFQGAAIFSVILITVVNNRRRAGLRELRRAELRLRRANLHLERRVIQRTNELERADNAKNEFLANMSHELRTPLNHIIGFTELVANEKLGDLNDVQREYLADVLGSSAHLLALIDEILDISKVEAGRVELSLAPVDSAQFIRDCVDVVAGPAQRRRIQINVSSDGGPESIRIDEQRMRQVLYNLLSNAIKFSPDGETIDVHTTGAQSDATTAEAWAIKVTDHGLGVAADDLEHIFEPFDRSSSAEANRTEGTGLGLSISRRLVELHGGRLWAESEGPGKGSVFVLELPLGPVCQVM